MPTKTALPSFHYTTGLIPFALLFCLGHGLTAEEGAESQPLQLAEEHWPIGMFTPDVIFTRLEADNPKKKKRKRKKDKAEILIWLPPGERVRAIFLIPNNTDSKHVGEHAKVREVATKHQMAIVYLRNHGGVHWALPSGKHHDLTQIILDAVAEHCQKPDIAKAPWILFGKSSLGRFPINLAWAFPERTIACITYHGETPPWPFPAWATKQDGHSIPYVNINGDSEWMSTWYRHVRPMHLNIRKNTDWLPHQVVLRGVGHGNYRDGHNTKGWGQPVAPTTTSIIRVWDYIAVYINSCLERRLPKEGFPADGPVTLQTIDPDDGILVHRRAVEVLPHYRWRPIRFADNKYQIVNHKTEPHEVYDENPGKLDPAMMVLPAEKVPAQERRDYLWIADAELAEAWKALHAPLADDAP